jgi:hypothetical protein
MKRLLFLALLGLGMAGPAAAGFVTGDKLFEFCQARSGSAQNVYCLGYIVGVADMVDDPLLSKVLPSQAKFCVPDKLQSNQLKDVVVSYLQNNPQERVFQAQALIVVALSKAYPCKK